MAEGKRVRLRSPGGATLFRGSAASDTLVVSHYPVGGNDRNTGPRYGREAALTGYDVLGVTRVGTNTCRADPRLRRRLAPEVFDDLCGEAALDLAALCRDYRYVIMRGQSTGAFPTLGIVRSGVLPVTHLLIEDGINTRRSRRNSARGPLTSRLDWFRYSRKEKEGMARPPRDGWAPPDGGPDPWRRAAWFLVEQYHWAPLWRSSYSRDALLEIARTRRDLPVLVKCLGNTALTTPNEVCTLRRDLGRAVDGPRPAPCVIDLDEDAWHGFLVYAEYGAANLRATRRLHP
jgi:hypothetical protein